MVKDMKIHLQPQQVLDVYLCVWQTVKRWENMGQDIDPRWDQLVNQFDKFAKQAKKLQNRSNKHSSKKT